MGHKMKYTKGGFPFKSSPAKVDLTKKSGFGPKAAKGSDDQSKELAKSRYEMGEYKNDPTETGAQVEKREDAEGKGSGSNRKVMKDGYVNPTQKKKLADRKAAFDKKTPAEKQAMQDAANDKADKFHKRGKYAGDMKKYSDLEKYDDDR